MLVHKGFHFMKSLFFLVNIDVHIHLFFLHYTKHVNKGGQI